MQLAVWLLLREMDIEEVRVSEGGFDCVIGGLALHKQCGDGHWSLANALNSSPN